MSSSRIAIAVRAASLGRSANSISLYFDENIAVRCFQMIASLAVERPDFMKLSFLPGDLHLNKEQDGTYLVTVQGQELLRTRIEKKALTRFNALRKELEKEFPTRLMTPEQKRGVLEKYLVDYKAAEVRASTKPPKKEKIKGTRTFG